MTLTTSSSQPVTDEVIDGLSVAEYLQGDSRFIGFDAKGSVRLGEQVWLNLGLGLVDAELTTTNEALPRIPPLRGQLSVDVPYRGFTITPEWIFASKQDRVFREETETDGYFGPQCEGVLRVAKTAPGAHPQRGGL